MKLLRRLSVLLLFVGLAFAQSDFIAPNENLVVQDIPKVPAALADAASRYGEFRTANFQSWHPTRREMLITTRFADTNQVHRVTMPGGDRTQLTFFPDRVGFAQFSPTNGDVFLFEKDIGGGEFFQLYRFDLPTGAITLLTDGKSRNTDPVWSYQGDRVAYGSTRRNGKDVDIWTVNPADPKSDHMLAQFEGGGWQSQDWSPDGKTLLVMNQVSVNETYLWIVDTATGEKTELTPKQGTETVAYGGSAFSKDGKGVYTTTDKDAEFQRLTYIDLATKKHTTLTPNINWDVDEAALSYDGKLIAFVTNEDGVSVLHLLDTRAGKERPAPKLPVGIIGGVSWHKDNHDLGFSIASARSPNDAYSLDIATGKVERWTTSETGGLNVANFAEPELIHWKSWDGRSISGFLYKPPASFSGKRPVIINIHGGPEGQDRPGFRGRNNYYLNELGVAMIFPNVRGSTGYGKSFEKMDNGFLREGSYKDIGSLLEWIKTRPELDADRIMITGGSYGGFMTLAVATNYNDLIRCSVDVVGPSNLVTFLEHTSPYRVDLRRVEYGDERDSKMREFLERIAPANKAKNITKPLFVIQGKNDPRVPASESQQMVEVVRHNGTPVWFLMANDEGHGFAKKKNQDFQFYSTIEFVKEFLLK